MNETAAWALVAGVVLATFSGVVVPFITGSLTRRSERITQTLLNRRKALDEWLDAKAKYNDAVQRADLSEGVPSSVEMSSALDRLESQFTTSDQEARRALIRFTSSSKSEDLAVVATWAAGREQRAGMSGRAIERTIGLPE
jgi:F0F1-type ATP synthase membrane subunit b/b'